MFSLLREAWMEQSSLVNELHSDRRTRAPFETMCLAAFGSSLHEAVTSFFYLRLGASAKDVGTINSIALGVGLVLNPLVGTYVDRRGVAGALILSSLACAVGCLLRGLASNIPQLYVAAAIYGVGGGSYDLVAVTYFASVLDRERRSEVLAGLVVQTVALRLVAKAAFPLAAGALARVFPDDELTRLRVSLSVCYAFCFYGVLRISTSWRDLVRGPLGKFADQSQSRHRDDDDDRSTDRVAEDENFDAMRVPSSSASSSSTMSTTFLLAAGAVMSTAVVSTSATVLWPIIVRDRFGWGAERYSILILVAAVGRVCATSFVPVCERRVGRAVTAMGATFTSLLATVALIRLSCGDGDGDDGGSSSAAIDPYVHASLVLAHLISLSFLEVPVRSAATLALPPSHTSRSFGLTASLTSLGGVIGSVVGTRTYDPSHHPLRPMRLSAALQVGLIILLVAAASRELGRVDGGGDGDGRQSTYRRNRRRHHHRKLSSSSGVDDVEMAPMLET